VDDAQVLRRLLDYEEIRQLVARYAFSIDTRDLDALVALFVDDVAVGKQAQGRDALKSFFAKGLSEIGASILSVTTHVIDLVDDDHATGEVYCTGEIERDGAWLRQAILYRDQYRRTDEGWRFVQRDHLLWYSAPQSSNPRDLPQANWPKGHVGRGTVPECFDTYVQFMSEHGPKSGQ